MSKPVRSAGKTALKRMSGFRIGLLRAQVTAVIVGTGAAVVTYRLLRSGN